MGRCGARAGSRQRGRRGVRRGTRGGAGGVFARAFGCFRNLRPARIHPPVRADSLRLRRFAARPRPPRLCARLIAQPSPRFFTAQLPRGSAVHLLSDSLRRFAPAKPGAIAPDPCANGALREALAGGPSYESCSYVEGFAGGSFPWKSSAGDAKIVARRKRNSILSGHSNH